MAKMTRTIQTLLMFVIVFTCIYKARCANILGYFSTFSRSHYIIEEAVMKGLAVKGHNVSMHTRPITNYHKYRISCFHTFGTGHCRYNVSHR